MTILKKGNGQASIKKNDKRNSIENMADTIKSHLLTFLVLNMEKIINV